MEKFAPDIAQTVRRFPFAIVLLAIATILLIGLVSEYLNEGDETYIRLTLGLFTGALFATAGQIWSERTGRPKALQAVIIYLIPVLVAAAMQLRTFEWVMPWPLFPIAFLWMSIAGFTEPGKPEARETLQNQFWWINHRAVSTAVLATIGFAIIALGLTAIERSMSLLFGISSEKLFYAYLLPFTGMFLTPVYWLSTIPRLEDYAPTELEHPDFLSRAIGFLGQFVLVPLLLAYSAILLAYAIQILLNWALPEGTLGWMILGYLVIGAATWLVLHPPFMREKQVVKIFHRFWVWLTIVPLVLYAIAVFTRVDAYGLTEERILLIAGGVWGALLTLAFLTRRFADIRLIPALAAIIFLFLSIGPWNIHNLAVSDQANRFTRALDAAGWRGDSQTPAWTSEQANTARSALNYLTQQDQTSRATAALTARGLDPMKLPPDSYLLAEVLHLPATGDNSDIQGIYYQIEYPRPPVNLGVTNIYLGDVSPSADYPSHLPNLDMYLSDDQLIIKSGEQEIAKGSISDWVTAQGQVGTNRTIVAPLLTLQGTRGQFNLLITSVYFTPGEPQRPQSIFGTLYADRLPAEVTPSPSDPQAPAS